MKIRVFFTGRSYLLADELPETLELPEAAQLSDALRSLREHAGQNSLPNSCLVSVSGRHQGTLDRFEDCPLKDGDELTLIAPVAGG